MYAMPPTIAASETRSTNRDDSKSRPLLRKQKSTAEDHSKAYENDSQERVNIVTKTFGLGPNLFSKKIVNQMQDDKAFKHKMFAEWKHANLNASEMRKKLKAASYSDMSEYDNEKLLLEYLNFVNVKAPSVQRNRRVHFGDDGVHYFPAGGIDEITIVAARSWWKQIFSSNRHASA